MAATMQDRGRMYLIGLIAVALVVVLLIVAIGLGGRSRDGDEDEEGPWDDLTGFKSTASNIEGIRYYEAGSPLDLADEGDPSTILYFLIGIESPLTSDEMIAIRDFVLAGGKVVVADDGTNGNDLGNIPSFGGGGSVRFEGHRYIVQAGIGDPDPGFLVNRSFVKSIANIGGWNYDLIVHDPNGLNFTGEGFVWLRTTEVLTVIDLNDNYVQETSDRHTPFGPIAVGYEVGDKGGSIIYFSSTGLFTDNVYGLRDNEAFVRSFIDLLLPNEGSVVLDQSKEASRTSPHRSILPGE